MSIRLGNKQCPQCRAPVTRRALRRDRTLEEVIKLLVKDAQARPVMARPVVT